MIVTSPAVLKIDRNCFILEFLDQEGYVANTIVLKDLTIDISAREMLSEPFENGVQK